MYSKTAQVKKKKKRGKTWYRDKMDTLFSKIIRQRDERCQKCGNTNSLQCSHVIPKSQSLPLRWDNLNAKALCLSCHLYWWHKDILAAQEWFTNTFPDRSKYLEEHRNDIIKFSLDDYKEMYEKMQSEFTP